MDEVVRIHASSGTTGKQTVVGYTKHDLDDRGEVMALNARRVGGVDEKDIGHISRLRPVHRRHGRQPWLRDRRLRDHPGSDRQHPPSSHHFAGLQADLHPS